MKKQNQELLQRIIDDETEAPLRLLVEAEQIARMRGEMFGLCDCIDNCGNPYPSQFLADTIKNAMARGIKPQGRKVPIAEKFKTGHQWER